MPSSGIRKDVEARRSVLIHIEGGVADAIFAEPAVAAFCQMSSAAVTVASVCADIYVGHPHISGILYPDADGRMASFESVRVIPACPDGSDARQRLHAAASALGVQVGSSHPVIYLTGLDAIRAERFKLTDGDAPLAALCLSDTSATETVQHLSRLCHLLSARRGATVAVLSGRVESSLNVHRLAGRLTCRETASVLSRCDVWFGDDPAYAALALAVGAPGVFVSDEALFENESMITLCPAEVSEEALWAAIETMWRTTHKPITGRS